jgi:hypothetical protein
MLAQTRGAARNCRAALGQRGPERIAFPTVAARLRASFDEPVNTLSERTRSGVA